MSSLYIDADNISYKYINKIINNVDFSNLIIKKIYGDWSKPELKNWIDIVINYGFKTIKCFRIGKKQSTDIKLITDLTNDLYLNNLNHIYLVSSDIDFSHMCQLIKKKNIKLTIISLQDTILKNYSDKFINLNKDDVLHVFIQVMNNNYVMLLSKFKKEVKKILKLNKKIDENLKDYINFFMIVNKKNKTYIISINEFTNYTFNDFIRDKIKIKQNYKTIFLIISFNELKDYLFN